RTVRAMALPPTPAVAAILTQFPRPSRTSVSGKPRAAGCYARRRFEIRGIAADELWLAGARFARRVVRHFDAAGDGGRRLHGQRPRRARARRRGCTRACRELPALRRHGLLRGDGVPSRATQAVRAGRRLRPRAALALDAAAREED